MTPNLVSALSRATQRVGVPQVSGPMAIVPLFGPDRVGYAGPRSGLRLGDVHTYGSLDVESAGPGLCIVPLHIGWIQKGAQNHALCRSLFLAPGEKVRVDDACCVQASQGGYLEGADQWFFVLPLGVREAALSLRGTNEYSKLWDAITAFNKRFGRTRRGHLEQVIGSGRATLTRFRSRFELLDGQSGALFFLRGALVGFELAPNPAYFAELWPALVSFAYGAEAWGLEAHRGWQPPEEVPLAGDDLEALADALQAERRAHAARLLHAAERLNPRALELRSEDRCSGHELFTAEGDDFVGQVVRRDDDSLVYASLYARTASLEALLAA